MKKKYLNLLNSVVAYDNSGVHWKTDDAGNVILNNGNPVYVDSAGQERSIEPDTIGKLNNEAKDFRIKKEEAEKRLKVFEGLDPELARKAIETVDKIDAKSLIDAGKVDEVKTQISNQFTQQLQEKDKALSEKDSIINNMKIDGIFANSEFVRDNVNVRKLRSKWFCR